METEPRTIIAVRPASALAARPRLFAALEAAFPVSFEAWAPGAAEADAVIVITQDPRAFSKLQLREARVPMLVLPSAEAEGGEEAVRLSDAAAVDPRVRGTILYDRLAGPPLVPEADRDDVLAAAGSSAVWTRCRGVVPVHTVRCALPELRPNQVLPTLVWERGIVAVALIQFLRALSRRAGWHPQPLRATFVFDDPNLRWRSYGFIDYRRLVRHADAHGYHAAMAMIPLDAGRRPHRAIVSLFTRHRERLSLVVHGNDHIKQELLRPHDRSSALALAAQAVRRIERFESRWGLPVDRVMMPPHGMCSEEVSRALAAVGFDALCAIHPHPWTGREPASPPLAGWWPAEFVAGSAVIRRIHLRSPIGEIALHAFLDHPLVFYGHHEDVAEGLEPLAELAERVNRLGDVRWTSVGEIARTNYAQRVTGDRAVLRPYARRIRFVTPAGVRALRVERPRDAIGEADLRGWSLGPDVVRPFGTDILLAHAGPHELRLHGAGDVHPSRVAAPRWRPWPKMRRAGTEMRDRMLPLRQVRAG